METSTLNTFEGLLTNGIEIEKEGAPEFIKFSKVYIPKIQRAYAQGRTEEFEVRKDFIDDIFDTICDDDSLPLELSFIFGSIQSTLDCDDAFELLDGQQRITTLFLLHWYIYNVEQNRVPDYLKKFTYETRDTSRYFIGNITQRNIALNGHKPSSVLKGKIWFTDDFYCDPTVVSMLQMLDHIDEKYKSCKCSSIAANLGKLSFYVLLLENFDMNDELYIKMNSRGLSLTAFENFKASIVRFMKDKSLDGKYYYEVGNPKQPFWLYFISRIDSIWIDIFFGKLSKNNNGIYEIRDKWIGNSFFKFFNRYFYVKAILLSRNDIAQRFYAISNEKLEGWKDSYLPLFSCSPEGRDDFFAEVSRIFDIIYDHQKEIETLVRQDPFGNITTFGLISDFFKQNSVAFCCVIEFLASIPDDLEWSDDVVQCNFKQMLRVLWNVVENTKDNNNTSSVIKTMSEIIRTMSGTQNFYQCLADKKFPKNIIRQFLDEQVKAKRIIQDSEWEEAFIQAETHPFFKGDVRFFYEDDLVSPDNLTERYVRAKELFDSDGVSPEYRQKGEHLFIRALFSCLNDRSIYSYDIPVIEKVDDAKHLKAFISTQKEIRNMFLDFYAQTECNIREFLIDRLNNTTPKNPTDYRFNLFFHRMTDDSNAGALYDWIYRETQWNKVFVVQERNHYSVAIRSTTKFRIILDTERHLIIPQLVKDFNLKYEAFSQEIKIESDLNDCPGKDISLLKKIGDFSIKVSFTDNMYDSSDADSPYRKVRIYLYGDVEKLSESKVFDYKRKNTEGIAYIELEPLKYFRFEDSYQRIKDKLTEIETKLLQVSQ